MPINSSVKLCNAKARQNNNQPCRQPGMLTNGRCRLHGGKSTGAKTEQGKIKSAQANFKHGRHTKQALCDRETMRTMMKWRKDLSDLITMD